LTHARGAYRICVVDARLVAMNGPFGGTGALAGLITMDNIGEFLMVQAAERKGVRVSDPASTGNS
jgi:hypothetical protein